MEPKYAVGDLSIHELSTGLKLSDAGFTCIVCGDQYETGRIYEIGGSLLTAERAADEHTVSEHGGALNVLAQLRKESSGLTDVQRELVAQLSLRKSDRDIARDTHKSESTIRNQRFHLRRKINEAKVLCAIGELLDTSRNDDSSFVSYHADIPSADDRIVTTHAEERDITSRYFESINPLKLERFPKKQKEKLVVLKRIASVFTVGQDYAESEVNDVITPIFDDYVTIRRYLIEYRFLDRERGGKRYWVHGGG